MATLASPVTSVTGYKLQSRLIQRDPPALRCIERKTLELIAFPTALSFRMRLNGESTRGT